MAELINLKAGDTFRFFGDDEVFTVEMRDSNIVHFKPESGKWNGWVDANTGRGAAQVAGRSWKPRSYVTRIVVV